MIFHSLNWTQLNLFQKPFGEGAKEVRAQH